MGLVFTKQINNTTFVLDTADGVRHVSVKNSSASAVNISITGTLPLNGLASAAMNLAQGDIVTISSDTPIDGLTVTSGSVSALADIICTQ
tara:strand:- start:1504 stop:1773 length:270 start_codon:yes stop_codon:yes gene_type:complete